MQILVASFGAFVGKTSERLVIKEKGKVTAEVPFADIEHLTIATGGVTLSSDVIRECAERGIQITFLSSSGNPYAKLVSPHLTATVVTRREQLYAYRDERAVALAVAFIQGKIKNQINTLKYFGKYRKSSDPETYCKLQEVVKELTSSIPEVTEVMTAAGKGGTDNLPLIDQLRPELLSIEGWASKTYWDAVQWLTEGKIVFEGREHRGATDQFNVMLNYGYGILYSQVWTAVLLAGLEPFAGFLHVDRPGKPSLVLDLIEEFRQHIVDRAIISAVNKGFTVQLSEGKLTDESRRALAEKILERLETEETFEGQKLALRAIIQRQARRLASYLRGESAYRPFVGGW